MPLAFWKRHSRLRYHLSSLPQNLVITDIWSLKNHYRDESRKHLLVIMPIHQSGSYKYECPPTPVQKLHYYMKHELKSIHSCVVVHENRAHSKQHATVLTIRWFPKQNIPIVHWTRARSKQHATLWTIRWLPKQIIQFGPPWWPNEKGNLSLQPSVPPQPIVRNQENSITIKRRQFNL